MEKVVIIGANNFQNPIILKAKELGYETHVFAWKEGAIGEKNADFFYPISITEKETILEYCRNIKPSAVLSIGSDLAVTTVNYIGNRLGMVCNSDESSIICTNKFEMRKALQNANIKVPFFQKVGLDEKIDFDDVRFPVIVKPTDRSGSRGVFLAQNIDELKNAIKASIESSFEKKAIVEEFIEGNEYSCESISYRGQHHILAITKKFTTGAPNFIETAHLQAMEASKELEEKVREDIIKGLDALNIKNGPSHTEFKIDPHGNMRIIEIGARMGGDCIGSDLVKISTGYDFLKLTLDVALGKKIVLEKVSDPKVAYIKFIFNQNDLIRLKKIKERYEDKIHYVSEISDFNHKITDSSSRYGYYILQCENLKELDEIQKL